MTDVDPNAVAARSKHVLTGPQSIIDVAVARVEGFLSQQRRRLASLRQAYKSDDTAVPRSAVL